MRSTLLFAAASLGSRLASAQCEVYGIDIQNGGTYFENSELTVPFSLVQEFSGCQNDTANNILVDPNGDQYECSDTPLVPAYTPETVTCSDWPQDKLYSGDWSLVVISNNGDGSPIAYQRDFSLTVGTPTTVTITPTVTATDVETSISSILSTTSSTITTTLVPSTTTTQAWIAFATPTLLSHPLQVQVVTKDLFTVTKTQYAPQVTATTVEAQASCASPTPNWHPDPIATIQVTIHISIQQRINSAKFKRGVEQDAASKKEFVEQRAERLRGLQKRVDDGYDRGSYDCAFYSHLNTTSGYSDTSPSQLCSAPDFDPRSGSTYNYALGCCTCDYDEECAVDGYDYSNYHAFCLGR
ncbi:hypothetical protein KCU81_g3359, partial [Aureobasidium melanogenum]